MEKVEAEELSEKQKKGIDCEVDHRYELQNLSHQSLPKKIVFLSIAFAVIGAAFVIFGIYDLLFHWSTDFDQAIAFFIIGMVLLIPGCYYTTRVIGFYQATTNEQKQQILNEFPLD